MYLCTAGGVLRGAACDELRAVVLEQVFVEGHVLFFGEDGVVGLEAVLGEHGLITREMWSVLASGGTVCWDLPLALDI